MKKLYTLFVAVLVALTANAQVSVQKVDVEKKGQVPYSAIRTNLHQNQSRSTISDAAWIWYPSWEAAYNGVDNSAIQQGALTYLKSNRKGLFAYQDGYHHGFVHSVSQSYDFVSDLDFFDLIIGEGSMSFKYTEKLNLDSVEIVGVYLRDEDYTGVDTLVVSFWTDNSTNYYYFGQQSSTYAEFPIDFDSVNGYQVDAKNVFKLPLTAENVSQPGSQPNTMQMVAFGFATNITDITDKRWNVAYTFKSGQGEGYEDTLKSRWNAYFTISVDPNYYAEYNQNRVDNMSHGQYAVTGSSGYLPYYYPGFLLGKTAEEQDMSYPEGIYIKVSCAECEIVGVPEVEKKNVSVYPNPATEKFTVELSNNEETANVQLFNIVGQQVYSGVVNGKAEISTSRLNSGVYMLKINQNGKVYTSKVIVK